MDNILARNRWFLVSIVTKWHELYSSDFLFPLNGFIEAWLSPRMSLDCSWHRISPQDLATAVFVCAGSHLVPLNNQLEMYRTT